MNDIINWKKYVDHIYAINYLPNNRHELLCKRLLSIGININDRSLFDFEYGIENKLFVKNIEEYATPDKMLYAYNYSKYIFELGLNVYHILKIAQFKQYNRIIIFEDDICFHKDLNFIKNALNYISSINSDIVFCDTNFERFKCGAVDSLELVGLIHKTDNDFFMHIKEYNDDVEIYGAAFMILSKDAINILIDLFEEYQLPIGLDMINMPYFRDKINTLNIYAAIKPLGVQEILFSWDENTIKGKNRNININEYNKL